MDQVLQFVIEGRPLPRRAVAVTFDDGFADNYECALPILMHYGVPATFYIMVSAVESGDLPWYCRLNFALRTTSRPEWIDPAQHQTYKLSNGQEREVAFHRGCEIGARKVGCSQQEFVRSVEDSLDVEPCTSHLMMTWEQVRGIKKAGHTIGAHTLSHPNLAHISCEEAHAEIEGCKQKLEKAIGDTVDHFSYPHPALNPQWSPDTFQITRKVGFKSAVLTKCGPIRRGDEPLRLKRIYAANDLHQWTWNLDCTFVGRYI